MFFSAASVWEASIKARRGKLRVDIISLPSQPEQAGFRELPVRARHATRAALLPLLHDDPFDRLLVAQAIDEALRLLTVDKALTGYSELVELV